MVTMSNTTPLNPQGSQRPEAVHQNNQLVDNSGRFNRLQRAFQNQLKALANEFYKTYQKPLVLTDTVRTDAEQARAHLEKPSLALPAGHPNARHPKGLAVDVDQGQASQITSAMLTHNGLHLPALSKGETWHIEPISTSGRGSGALSSSSIDQFQPMSRSGSSSRLVQGVSQFRQQSRRPDAMSPLMQPGSTDQGASADRRRLQQAAVEVESIFLEQLLGQMRSTLVDPITPSRQKFRGYLSMADQQLARSLAAGGGIGLASRIIKDLASLDSHPKTEKPHDGNTPVPGKTGSLAGTQPV
jgi:Rod binding domain-containing protein